MGWSIEFLLNLPTRSYFYPSVYNLSEILFCSAESLSSKIFTMLCTQIPVHSHKCTAFTQLFLTYVLPYIFCCYFTSKARPHCEIMVIYTEDVLRFRHWALGDVRAPFQNETSTRIESQIVRHEQGTICQKQMHNLHHASVNFTPCGELTAEHKRLPSRFLDSFLCSWSISPWSTTK